MWLEVQLEGDIAPRCLHLALHAASFAFTASVQPEVNTCPGSQIDGFHCVCVCEGVVVSFRAGVSTPVCVFVGLTLAVAQVLDLDAFLLLTGRLLHLAGVVIGMTI